MTLAGLESPEKDQLWSGAILGSIAHALIVARYPELAHEQSWDGTNYCVQNSSGSRGTVAFSGKQLVAVFFSKNSDRNPYNSDEAYNLQRFLVGLPDELASLAHDEALQYVLQDYIGNPSPIVTAAFWASDKQPRMAAAEAWREVFVNGANLIKNQLLNQDESLAAWQAEYELSGEEVALVRSLHQRKLAQSESRLRLTAADYSLIRSIATDEEGLEASQESFSEIGILM